jgi:hypothetical protein
MATEFLAVELNLSTFEITCPCLWTVETGKPCYHGAAVIIKTESEWNEPRRFYKIYHLSTYKRMYEKPAPALSTSGVLLKSHPILPPGTIARRDVPRQSVKSRSLEGSHFEKSCLKLSTQRRFDHYRQDVEKSKALNDHTRSIVVVF